MPTDFIVQALCDILHVLSSSKTSLLRTMHLPIQRHLRCRNRDKRRRNLKIRSCNFNDEIFDSEHYGRQTKDGECRRAFRRHHNRKIFTSNRSIAKIRRYRKILFHKNLLEMDHIIFWDMDNWACLFQRLQYPLPDKTFVWGFHCTKWKPPIRCSVYRQVMNRRGLYLQKQSGKTQNASDFALMLQVGRLDERLPEHIKFTILSGDEGFREAVHQFRGSGRTIRLINPHRTDWQERYWYHDEYEDLKRS